MIEITPIETIDGKIRAPPPQRAIPIGTVSGIALGGENENREPADMQGYPRNAKRHKEVWIRGRMEPCRKFGGES